MPAPVSKDHRCDICNNTFVRAEHLQRHRRIHTREKPYPCQLCAARFSRSDLLRRHLDHYHDSNNSDISNARGGVDNGSTDEVSAPRKRQRLKAACDNCNLRKLKCDAERPCARCKVRQVECTQSGRQSLQTESSAVTQEITPVTIGHQSGTLLPSTITPHSPDHRPAVHDAPVISDAQPDVDQLSLTFVAQTSSLPALSTVPQACQLAAHSPDGQHQPAPVATIPNLNTNSRLDRLPAVRPQLRSVHFESVPALDSGSSVAFLDPQLIGGPLTGPNDSLPTQNWFDFPVFVDDFDFTGPDILRSINSFYESFPTGDMFEDIGIDAFLTDPMELDASKNSFFGLPDLLQNNTGLLGLNDELSMQKTRSDNRTPAMDSESSDAHARFRELSELHPSRPPSPRFQHEKTKWIAGLGKEDPAANAMIDRTLIDEFLWLFQDRVAPWFSCFRNLELSITPKTRKDWYLAMAAVGALHCHVEGSIKVALWLYHCARQKLFSFVYQEKSPLPTIADGFLTIETYMLLEIFGYLSGEKRIYELTEALHGQMFQVAFDLHLFEDNKNVDETKRQSILESLLVLDCYRVVLIQRSPVMPLYQSRSQGDTRSVFRDGSSREDLFANELISFTSPGGTVLAIDTSSESYRTLCCLALLTWNVVPPPLSHSSAAQSLWSRPFCELMLNQWVHAHDEIPCRNFMLLFHMIHINFMSSLPDVQNLVGEYLANNRGVSKATHNQRKRKDAHQPPNQRMLERLFVSAQERPRAVWHARQVLDQAIRFEDERHSSAREASEQENSGDNISRPHTDATHKTTAVSATVWNETEAPHFSYCVCFATLVLWCDELLCSQLDVQSSRKWLEMGIKILRDVEGVACPVNGIFNSILAELVACAG